MYLKGTTTHSSKLRTIVSKLLLCVCSVFILCMFWRYHILCVPFSRVGYFYNRLKRHQSSTLRQSPGHHWITVVVCRSSFVVVADKVDVNFLPNFSFSFLRAFFYWHFSRIVFARRMCVLIFLFSLFSVFFSQNVAFEIANWSSASNEWLDQTKFVNWFLFSLMRKTKNQWFETSDRIIDEKMSK